MTTVSSPSVSAILAAGRSGSTWLGAIINSHPDVVYRFEPFHRLQAHNPAIQRYARLLKRGEDQNHTLSDQDIPGMYRALLAANPLTNKPPFFSKPSVQTLGPTGNRFQKNVWATSRAIAPLRPLYRALYTPQNQPPLIFKEVTFERQMAMLLNRTSMPVVYLVRHPCGNVLSDVNGQSSGKMPTGRQSIIQDKLKNHDDPELFDRYSADLEDMSPLEKTALLWRLDLEKGLKAVEQSDNALLVTYEQLCDDAHKHVHAIFEHFKLTVPPETVAFLDALYGSEAAQAKASQGDRASKDWMNSFFTVYRNPKKQRDSWKVKISPEMGQKIEAIVGDSWAFQRCAKIGQWD